jgi:comEA protein
MEQEKLTDIVAKVALKAAALLFVVIILRIGTEYHEYNQYLAKERAINLSRSGNQVECSADKVNVNQAGARELEKLPGIGKVLAQSIIHHRGRHGAFRRIEGLLAVRGIGEKKFRKLSTMICTE